MQNPSKTGIKSWNKSVDVNARRRNGKKKIPLLISVDEAVELVTSIQKSAAVGYNSH